MIEKKHRYLKGLLLLSLINYLLVYSHYLPKVCLFVYISLSSSILFLFICICLRNLVNTRVASKGIIGVIIFFGITSRLVLFWHSPSASDDLYRYLWDGKVQAHGINPYKYSPIDEEVAHLQTEAFPDMINFPEMKTVYPPVAEWFFLVGYFLVPQDHVGMKILLFISEIATIWLLSALLILMNRSPINIGYYACCPLPIMQFMIEGHLDALAFPFVIMSILLFMKTRNWLSSIVLGLAMAIKLLPMIILPALIREAKSLKSIIILTIPGVLLLGSLYLPYLWTGGYTFESLRIFSSRFYFNGLLFHVMHVFFDNNIAHTVVGIIFFFGLSVVLLKHKKLMKTLYLTFFVFFLCSPTVHPWYLCWLLIWLPFHFRWSGIFFVILINLSNIVYIDYLLAGIWQESTIVLAAEYLPIYGMFFYELIRPNTFLFSAKSICD